VNAIFGHRLIWTDLDVLLGTIPFSKSEKNDFRFRGEGFKTVE